MYITANYSAGKVKERTKIVSPCALNVPPKRTFILLPAGYAEPQGVFYDSCLFTKSVLLRVLASY